MRTPEDAIQHTLVAFEGGFQNMPSDSGNWVRMPDGSRKLIGTMRGITPAALAAYRGVPAHTITVADIKSVTPELASNILKQDYYDRPGYGRLPWCPLMESVMDHGINAGPSRATRMLQRMVGTPADGIIGPLTIDAVWNFLLNNQDAVDHYRNKRIAFYTRISRPGTKNHKFRKGWMRRATWYSTGNAGFMTTWKDNPDIRELYNRLSNEEMGAEPDPEIPVVEERGFWQRIMDWIERVI